MTLPFPNSPVKNENIATSISRIEQNLEYLDGEITTTTFKTIYDTQNMSTLAAGANTVNITGVGFQPTAYILFAVETTGDSMSWGMGDGTTEASIRRTYAGDSAISTSDSGFLQQALNDRLDIEFSSFDTDGATFTYRKTNSPISLVLAMFLFMK